MSPFLPFHLQRPPIWKLLFVVLKNSEEISLTSPITQEECFQERNKSKSLGRVAFNKEFNVFMMCLVCEWICKSACHFSLYELLFSPTYKVCCPFFKTPKKCSPNKNMHHYTWNFLFGHTSTVLTNCWRKECPIFRPIKFIGFPWGSAHLLLNDTLEDCP